MATNETAAAEDPPLSLRGAAGPAIGAIAAWLFLDGVVDPGGWPAGALLAGIFCLPLVGVGLRRRDARVALAALGAAVGLAGITFVRGGMPSAVLLALIVLCGLFLIGLGYALSDPEASAPAP